MDSIAWILQDTVIYWSAVVLTLAALAAVCFFLGWYRKKGGPVQAGAVAVPVSIILSLMLARLVHWYCRADSYAGLWAAMCQWSGGFALVGVFAGCILTAVLLRMAGLHKNLPQMLDCMSLAGAAGIALGRLAAFFTTADRGQIVQTLTFLPVAWPVTNAVSGAEEYRLATFLFQSVAALGFFLWLVRQDKAAHRDGDITLRFLLVYGASQVVLDSTRYDKLFFRSNGFVSLVQVMSAVGMVTAMVIFSLRLVKARGFRWKWLIRWLAIAGLLGGGGFMEYCVQRRGDLAVLAYGAMALCLMGACAVALGLDRLSRNNEFP